MLKAMQTLVTKLAIRLFPTGFSKSKPGTRPD